MTRSDGEQQEKPTEAPGGYLQMHGRARARPAIYAPVAVSRRAARVL